MGHGQRQSTARMRRIAYWAIALAAGSLSIALGWILWSSAHATPLGPVVNYGHELEQVSANAQPPGPDEWPTLLAAFDAMSVLERVQSPTGEERFFPNYAALNTGDRNIDGLDPADPKDARIIAQEVASADQAQQIVDAYEASDLPILLTRLASSPRAVRPSPEDRSRLADDPRADQGRAFKLARLLRAHAHQAACKGDWATATRDFEHMLAIARVYQLDATISSVVAGSHAKLWTLTLIDEWLIPGTAGSLTHTVGAPPPPDALRALADAMDRQPQASSLATAIAGERLIALDAIQWTHTDSGRAIPTTDLAIITWIGPNDTVPPIALANLRGYVWPSASQTRTAIDDLYAQAIALAKLPASNRAPANVAFMGDIDRNWLTSVLGLRSTIERVLPTLDTAIARHNLTRTALALELHRARTGSLPATLADLTEANAPDFTRDPITADQPLRYHIDPAHPSGFLLYSIGLNCTDNNAAPAPKPLDPDSPGDLVWGATP